jgi:citrate synthase
LGVTEDCAHFLARELKEIGDAPTSQDGWDAAALNAVQKQKDIGKFVPGLGHPVHKQGDPRTPVLMAMAREQGLFGSHLSLFEAIGRVHSHVLGKTLPLNGAGVCGAVLADAGIPMGVMRGVALLARCAGLLGHLVEEQTDPIGIDVYMNVDRNIDYQPPK